MPNVRRILWQLFAEESFEQNIETGKSEGQKRSSRTNLWRTKSEMTPAGNCGSGGENLSEKEKLPRKDLQVGPIYIVLGVKDRPHSEFLNHRFKLWKRRRIQWIIGGSAVDNILSLIFLR